MTVAVLALQGAFAEHENVLKRLGVDCIEFRQAKDLETPYDGIILPGGESTVQGKLLKELGMFDTIKEQIENGMPVLATCAGLILLASEVEGQEVTSEQSRCASAAMPMADSLEASIPSLN